MTPLQNKVLKHSIKIIEAFDTYAIYTAIRDASNGDDDKQRQITTAYQNAIAKQMQLLTEAKQWLTELSNETETK